MVVVVVSMVPAFPLNCPEESTRSLLGSPPLVAFATQISANAMVVRIFLDDTHTLVNGNDAKLSCTYATFFFYLFIFVDTLPNAANPGRFARCTQDWFVSMEYVFLD